MPKYIINGNKIANGNASEQLKLVYLVNPVAFTVLLRSQGHEISDLADLTDLIEAVKKKQKRVDFVRIIRLTPINDKMLRAASGNIKLVGKRTDKPARLNTRHNLDLLQ